ncbi:hypothetical protein VroAM7_48850 (plasmid) [Vibrio rotiferianus]|uniref:Uncharacterized protein n=1 Tax=Vibrio rotiferianus TaxID=190895 RepID=A0A510IEN2_9VIBR|nr:hypothetical protein [Vibrio rotiferianus]BBL92232.1 hypothetical protein VroAM7_48850 [Vibrio rotiferianus]
MYDKLCTDKDCFKENVGSLLSSGQNGQRVADFSYQGKDWQSWLQQEGVLVRLIDTHSGDRLFVEPALVYCSGAIDAALSHISFNAIEVYISDARLYLNLDLNVIFVWQIEEGKRL